MASELRTINGSRQKIGVEEERGTARKGARRGGRHPPEHDMKFCVVSMQYNQCEAWPLLEGPCVLGRGLDCLLKKTQKGEDYEGEQQGIPWREQTSFQGLCAWSRTDPVKRPFGDKTGKAMHCMRGWRAGRLHGLWRVRHSPEPVCVRCRRPGLS